MPYRDISELPKAQTDQYDQHQKDAFLKAFNKAYEEYNHDESRAFAVAHHAAKQARKKEASPQH
jgi:cation transport regulator